MRKITLIICILAIILLAGIYFFYWNNALFSHTRTSNEESSKTTSQQNQIPSPPSPPAKDGQDPNQPGETTAQSSDSSGSSGPLTSSSDSQNQILQTQLNTQNYREIIRQEYYKEFSYEACELNNFQGYNSKEDCDAAISCIAEDYSILIPDEEVRGLSEYMQKNGGEQGFIEYSTNHPNFNSELEPVYKKCLSGKYEGY